MAAHKFMTPCQTYSRLFSASIHWGEEYTGEKRGRERERERERRDSRQAQLGLSIFFTIWHGLLGTRIRGLQPTEHGFNQALNTTQL